ncbi:MAG: cysteine-rich CWC family protein [Gammaproteobacteria bacterium]|nr:cysteine-rich CWC family protein [Gammaproteobacteria bacterium]
MSDLKTKSCPRCQKKFECKPEYIKNCQCASIELKQHQYDYIFKQYDDCLCASCLEFLRAECEDNVLDMV